MEIVWGVIAAVVLGVGNWIYRAGYLNGYYKGLETKEQATVKRRAIEYGEAEDRAKRNVAILADKRQAKAKQNNP